MKKILIIFICLFLGNINALACDNYLTSLELTGYSYTPKFHKYNNYYSVTVPSNIISLGITYTTSEENIVTIKGNNPLTEEITIVLNCKEKEEIYTIYVNKEEEQMVFKPITIKEESLSKKEMIITIIIISIVSLFILFCIGYFIFRRPKC